MSKECASGIKDNQNMKMYGRNIPSSALQPYLNVRPVMTKYSKMPIVDPRKELNTQLQEKPLYNTGEVFNPGTSQAPWNGFAANINTDSLLRNQFFALQKCSEAEFIPSSKSSLYVAPLALNSKKEKDYTIVEEGILRECKMPEHKYLFNNSTRFERTLITNN